MFRVEKGSRLAGTTLAESDLRRQTGASLLAIQGDDGYIVNPPPTEQFEVGKAAILFGSPEQITRAAELFRTRETVV